MRVVHLNTERTWRGGERQTFWLARELKRRGHESWVACRPGFPMESASRDAGLPVIPVHPWIEMGLCAAFGLKDFLKREQVDVLHAHTGHAVGLGALSVLGAGTRLVATRRVDFHLKKNLLTRWKYRQVSAVVAISQTVRNILASDGLDPAKIAVVPSGIDASDYPSHAAAADLRRQKKFAPPEKIIVNAAALAPHKDQATLLSAMPEILRQVPEARLLILGDGFLRNSLEKKARVLKIDRRVDFLGHRPDVLEYIALADVFVLSSKEEGLGTSLIDAMAIGTPTVATSGGGIPEIYGGDFAGLVEPGDAAGLAMEIVAVLKDSSEARRRVEHGAARAAEFTVQKMADRYEKIYENILHR